MNERIKELAHQARLYAEEKQNDPYRIYTQDCFNEKFAELIVKKCISMADEFEMDVNRSGLVDKMKEYFGVEE